MLSRLAAPVSMPLGASAQRRAGHSAAGNRQGKLIEALAARMPGRTTSISSCRRYPARLSSEKTWHPHWTLVQHERAGASAASAYNFRTIQFCPKDALGVGAQHVGAIFL